MYDDDNGDGEEESDEDEISFGPRVRTEPDFKEFRSGERVEEKKTSTMIDSSPLEENGSGYLVQEDFSEDEEEFESRKNRISDLQQKVTLNQREFLELMLPSEVTLQKPLISKEEESRRHTIKSEEDDRLMASEVKWKNEDLVDDTMTTWYFWR